MWHELRRLVLLGVMKEVDERPRVVNARSVVFSNKKRLVGDVRELNELIDVEKLTLEKLDDAAELLEENFYGATSDLEAGYFQVGLAEEQKTLRGCAFENPVTGHITYFVSNTMIPGGKKAQSTSAGPKTTVSSANRYRRAWQDKPGGFSARPRNKN